MNYTQEQIDRANQVNLEQFLRSQGEQLIRSGNEFRWKSHDSLTVKGNKWFRHSENRGGYPIDFVMEFYDKTFPEAVAMLLNEVPAENNLRAVTEVKVKSEFKLPARNYTTDHIMKYLTEERKLPKELIEEFISLGLIYESVKYHNVVFVGNDFNGMARYAHIRGVQYDFPDSRGRPG